MTFTFRAQAFCLFIYITIICHDISQFNVCPHQVVFNSCGKGFVTPVMSLSKFDFSFQLLTDRVAMFVHMHTLYSSVRPFGVSCILGSYGVDGPEMFVIDPSGVSFVSIDLYHEPYLFT